MNKYTIKIEYIFIQGVYIMKVSIVGITGYSGLELVKLLNNHKNVTIASIHATKEIGRRLSELYPYLVGVCDLVIETFNAQEIMEKIRFWFFFCDTKWGWLAS